MRTGNDVQTGDEVFVVESTYGRRRQGIYYIPAKVTKAARVWLDVERTDGLTFPPRAWRLRRDTQDEGSHWLSRTRFLTPEQRKQEEATNVADAFLREQGINLDFSSPWRMPAERRNALATAIKILGEELSKVEGDAR